MTAPTEVIVTDEFEAWFAALTEKQRKFVSTVVGALEEAGFDLGFPHSSAIRGATFALRELRVQSGGEPLRVFYSFDPERDAVLLIGGNKQGDGKFYETMIPACETIWKQYLVERIARLKGKKP